MSDPSEPQNIQPSPVTGIYTRQGDAGQTCLPDGSRLAKDDARIELWGNLDELSAWLGRVMATLQYPSPSDSAAQSTLVPKPVLVQLDWLQERLFTLTAMLAQPHRVFQQPLVQDDVQRLEGWIDEYQQTLPKLQHFIYVQGHPLPCEVHLARTVCRRAERGWSTLQRNGLALAPHVMVVIPAFLNRLSDYLFVLARFTAFQLGDPQKEWIPDHESVDTE